nr:hypothetical protein [Candidatus Freyarchaeota archaeon]
MEKRFAEIADKISRFTTKRSYAAFLDDHGNILYSSLTKESEEAVKKLKSIFPVWNIGDYQLKKLPKSNILIYKVSTHIIVALDSYEKEGVLIIVGKRLEENFGNLFKDLESELPAAPVKELIEVSSKESNLGIVQKSSPTKGTEKIIEPTLTSNENLKLVGAIEGLKTETPRGETEVEMLKEPSIEPPSLGKVEETVTVSFPVLVDTKFLKKVKEPIEVKILELCDGGHTIDDIAEELKVPKIRVMLTTGDYSAKGVIRYVSGFKKIKR